MNECCVINVEVRQVPEAGREVGTSMGLGCIKTNGSSTETSLREEKDTAVILHEDSIRI